MFDLKIIQFYVNLTRDNPLPASNNKVESHVTELVSFHREVWWLKFLEIIDEIFRKERRSYFGRSNLKIGSSCKTNSFVIPNHQQSQGGKMESELMDEQTGVEKNSPINMRRGLVWDAIEQSCADKYVLIFLYYLVTHWQQVMR